MSIFVRLGVVKDVDAIANIFIAFNKILASADYTNEQNDTS